MAASRERIVDRTATRDTRLQDAKAGRHDAKLGIDDGLIERMRDGADQAGRRAARKLSVGIERENIANAVEALQWGRP